MDMALRLSKSGKKRKSAEVRGRGPSVSSQVPPEQLPSISTLEESIHLREEDGFLFVDTEDSAVRLVRMRGCTPRGYLQWHKGTQMCLLCPGASYTHSILFLSWYGCCYFMVIVWYKPQWYVSTAQLTHKRWSGPHWTNFICYYKATLCWILHASFVVEIAIWDKVAAVTSSPLLL